MVAAYSKANFACLGQIGSYPCYDPRGGETLGGCAVKTWLVSIVLSAAVMTCSGASLSAQSASSSMISHLDLTFDCDNPVHVTDYAVRGDFSAVLRPDRSASADLAISGFMLSSNVHFEAKLGGGRRPAPGGTAELRVLSRNQLQAIWSLPNNNLIADVTVHGQSCAVKLAIKLKPGQHEYSMWGGSKFYYCSTARVIGTTCQAQ